MSKWLEDVVLIVAIVLGLVIGLYLSYALVVQRENYPPTLITVFLAIGVSALIYRFMGGLVGNEFKVGLLSLGGAAAFFAGMIWFVGDRLRDEVRLYEESANYRSEIDTLEAQREHSRTLLNRQQAEIQRLREVRSTGECPRDQCTIANVRKMQPNDPFVQDIKRLVEGQEPPFRPTLREMTVRIAVVGGLGSNPSFNICRDKLDELNEGVDVPNPTVRFERTLEDGTNEPVRARRGGTISSDVCSNEQRDFDVQINCPVALTLFRDKIQSCAEAASLRGATVTIASLPD